MSLKEKLLILKQQGVSLKFISYLSNINENTLYGYNCGKRDMSIEKIEKVEKYVDLLLSLKK